MDYHTYLNLLSLVTSYFIAKEDTVMTTHTRGKRLGKSGLKAEKEFIFVWDFCPPRPQGYWPHTLHVGEFLKAWTVRAEPSGKPARVWIIFSAASPSALTDFIQFLFHFNTVHTRITIHILIIH
jgi:hypothetical protein